MYEIIDTMEGFETLVGLLILCCFAKIPALFYSIIIAWKYLPIVWFWK
jgi:hypothetical protein